MNDQQFIEKLERRIKRYQKINDTLYATAVAAAGALLATLTPWSDLAQWATQLELVAQLGLTAGLASIAIVALTPSHSL